MKKEAETNLTIYGDQFTQKMARKALPVLVRQAKASQKIYYSYLAEELNMPNPRNLGDVLGKIGGELLRLGKEWGTEIPPIQSLVINKSTGIPGVGISLFIENDEEFKAATDKQKSITIDNMLSKVFLFTRWDEVLEKLELQPSKTNPAVLKALLPGKSKHYGGGGESEEHRLLKEYIANTPSCVGLKGKRLRGNIEYIFPSADKIDILFKAKNKWIGVEVKSVKSNQEDILRGLYQCVKYRALIEAHQKVAGIPIDAEVLLALGGPFPPELFGVRNLLDIAVVDNIKIQLKA